MAGDYFLFEPETDVGEGQDDFEFCDIRLKLGGFRNWVFRIDVAKVDIENFLFNILLFRLNDYISHINLIVAFLGFFKQLLLKYFSITQGLQKK